MDFIPNPLIVPAGLIIGVLVAAPVGPVNVLCIQRAIERGFWGGIAAGLGAVLGDGLIALFAALGVGYISGAVEHHRYTIQAVGGIALFAFGAKLYFSEPRFEQVAADDTYGNTLRDYIWDIPQTFFLTITNPGAVLGLFAIFGGVSSFVSVTNHFEALLMVAAIVCGSIGWWVMLSNIIAKHRHRIDVKKLGLINRVGGLLLMLFGALLIAGVLGVDVIFWD